MSAWPTKDPQSVQDYKYTIPVDAGDSVASFTFEELTGTVFIADPPPSLNGADVTVWLSGGTEGETAVFRVAWVTTAGRDDDDVITLAVESHEYTPVALTGYAKPVSGDLRARYPAFAAVDAGTIQYWLSDAERSIDTTWSEGDYAPALLSLAAHNMALAGLGADNASLTGVPAGVTAMKSGSLALNFTPEAANARLTGDFTATRYGQEYQMLLRRNAGGPIVSDTGAVPTYGWPVYPLGWML